MSLSHLNTLALDIHTNVNRFDLEAGAANLCLHRLAALRKENESRAI